MFLMILRPNRLAGALVLLALALATAACTDDDTPVEQKAVPSAASSRPPSASAVPGAIDLSRASRLDARRFVREVLIRTDVEKGSLGRYGYESLVALGADGARLMARSVLVHDDVQDGQLWLESGDVRTPIRTPRHHEPQIVFAGGISDDWIVWGETTNINIGVYPWTLYARNRRTGRSFELVRSVAQKAVTDPDAGFLGGPMISGGRVYWVESARFAGRRWAPDLYGCDINDCHPELILQDAHESAVSGRDLYALQIPGLRAKGPRPTSMTLVRFDTVTGRRLSAKKIPLDGELPSGLAVAAGHAVWTLSSERDNSSKAVVYDLASGRTRTYVPPKGGLLRNPDAGPRFISWGVAGNARPRPAGYLLDLRTEAVWAVGDYPGESVGISGDHLVLPEAQKGSDFVNEVVVKMK